MADPKPQVYNPWLRRFVDAPNYSVNDSPRAEAEADPINHPAHYNAHPSGVECIEVAEHFNFCRGNAIKYLWRSGLKEGADAVEDLKKARWYLDREIQRLAATHQPKDRQHGEGKQPTRR